MVTPKDRLPHFDFHHGGISVPDLDAAIEWYGRMLDFVVESRFEIPQIPAKAAFIRRGSLRFELFEVSGAAGLPEDRRYPDRDLKTHGNKHVAFRICDIAPLTAALEARGADIALRVDAPFGRGIFVRDMAGNLIEFVEHGPD